ncbi:MAG: ribosome silencing factor [bacterium]
MVETEKKLKEIINILDDKQGENIFVYNVAESSGYTDYFVVVSGRSPTHTSTIAETVAYEVKKKTGDTSVVEGKDKSRWILIDFGDVVVHVMLDDVRHFYDIDTLFGSEQRIDTDQYLS